MLGAEGLRGLRVKGLALSLLLLLALSIAGAEELKPDQPGPEGAKIEGSAEPKTQGSDPEPASPPTPTPQPPAAEVPPEGPKDETDYATIGGIAAAILAGLGGGAYLLLAPPAKRKFKGDAVFLLGPCGGGKTSMLFQLRDGFKESKDRKTVTSMVPNETAFPLHSDDEPKTIRFIDFPGHQRVRTQLFDILEDCAAVVFVLDSSTFSAQAREIADFVLDLLTSPAMLKNTENMLIVCNKTDAMPDEMAGISPKVMVKRRIEAEIEGLRKSRAEALDDIANSERIALEVAGKVFKWTDATVNVEFTDASVAEGNIKAVREFVKKCRG